MALKLHNTLGGQLETFVPLNSGRATLYACGPTVYDHAHVGHARAAVTFDILVRHLEALGLKVVYVRNYTDVDDKIIRRAEEKGEDWRALAQRHIDSYAEDMEALGCLEPTHAPKATDYIEAMIEDIQSMTDQGLAYPMEEGDVYFDVAAYPPYGRLSRRSLEEQEAGARVAVDERKKNAADFALWKAAKAGEPAWPSPWGPGRPGWHIECSAMSFRLLGPEFDIHGGGLDLIFPHHENELAQSGALGRPLARFWTHNGFVRLNNEKMSKSLGNFFTVKDILKKFSGETLRFLLVSKHYRGPLDFSDEALIEAEKALERIYRALEAAGEFMAGQAGPAISDPASARPFQDKFQEAMDDDLNTAKALGVVFDLVRVLNRAVQEGRASEAAAFYAALKAMGEELGLWRNIPADFFKTLNSGRGDRPTPEEIEELIAARAEARAERNWAEADRLRGVLQGRGVLLEDKAGTTSWKFVR